jgi:hypothetical protein
MKRILLALSSMFICILASAQAYEIRFESGNPNVTLESVKAENLTKNITKNLSPGDVLVLGTGTYAENLLSDDGNLDVSPNPNKGEVKAKFSTNSGGEILISISTIHGALLYEEAAVTDAGNHIIAIEGLPSGINILTLKSSEYFYTAKMLTNSGIENEQAIKLSISTSGNSVKAIAEASRLKSTSSHITMPFSQGDELKYTGISGENEVIVNDSPTSSKTVTFDFIIDVEVSLPTVETTTIESITETAATSGGSITANGGATVTARGVCWSTTQNPTIDDSQLHHLRCAI